MKKICSKCKSEKEVCEFNNQKDHKDGLRSQCKSCTKESSNKYYANHLLEKKEHYLDNRKDILAYMKQYNFEHKIQRREEQKQRYQQNPQYYIHKNVIFNKKRRQIDPSYKLLMNLRRRMLLALQNNQKNGHTLDLLGCTIDELKQYIENQFQRGMTWKNHNQKGWHIDHKIPCSAFDLSDPIQQKECFNYKNLQPLWAEDNLQKSDKILNS